MSEEFAKVLMEDVKKFGKAENGNLVIDSGIQKQVIGKPENKSYSFNCLTCGEKITSETRPNKCACGGSRFKQIIEYSKEEIESVMKKFKDEKLLNLIHKELSKIHIGDDNLKMTTFLTTTSGLLNNPKRRQSIAITGNSSEGKDNLIHACLMHQPQETKIFVTNATQATIEDDLGNKRQIGFSEVNANRENGANKYLIEVIKQKSEGGTSSIKKDIRTGMKTARFEESEQASVLYGTTEAQMDEEMGTRFIRGSITTDAVRIKKVNDNTLDTFSDLNKLMKDSKEEESWIKIGLTQFFEKNNQLEVYLPYAKFLKDKIADKDIFDNSDPRSQRDIKRVLALTCAMTYIFQEQREIIDHGGKKILVSEPVDFINTLKISQEFFNQSYSGLDSRLTKVVEIMKEFDNEWIARDEIQTKMEIKKKDTIKGYCKTLADEGLIEGTSGKELNESEGLKIYNGNKIYYKRVQKGAKKPLIRVQINELKQYLEEKTEKSMAPFEIECLSSIKEENNTTKRVQLKGSFFDEKRGTPSNSKQIGPFATAPLKNEGFTDKEIESAGYSPEEINNLLGDKNEI